MGLFDFFRIDIDAGVRTAQADETAVIVDVREPDEYAAGHIPGSVNLPLSAPEGAKTLWPDRETPLYLYCATGDRSMQAFRQLRAMGYRRVTNIGALKHYTGGLEK